MKTLVHDWKKVLITVEATFRTAIEAINSSGYQVAIVVDDDMRMQGIVTDSDVRRCILKDIDLDQNVSVVMNRSPLIVSPELDEDDAHRLMVLNHFLHLPVVDGDNSIVGLHIAAQLQCQEERDESLVIMAGGKGKRLLPLTRNIPKPMLPIRGKPMLEHLIEKAKIDGFKRIVISVNYLADMIVDYFGSGSKFGVDITYLREDKPLGTAGALSELPALAKEKPIVVTNADLVTEVSFGELLHQTNINNVDGMMAVRTEVWESPFGVVKTQGGKLISIEEKPTYRQKINAGIYVLTPSLIDLLQKNEYCDMTDLFQMGLDKGLNLGVFALHENWLDIGRPDDFKKANS